MALSITVNSRKYDQTIRRSWQCDLVDERDGLLYCVGRFDADVSHPDLGDISRGTTSYEYFWLDRWYNIFRFHSPDGSFRNFYCNVSMPPTLNNGVLDYVDLDIDVVVWPDLSYQVLDVGEFKANAALFDYPEVVRSNAARSLEMLMDMIAKRQLPFAGDAPVSARLDAQHIAADIDRNPRSE